ncbi:transglutaminase-like domain-containing protein [Oceanospirillum sediminis]|uniref:Transglutaminase domain-containing protein n=1 Tax=Oceanospirillum sediminis TaxID=2760088 RepID=A0A839IPX1_9GAMM|nr:transglutaminase-like domain-containing protein [Oceanospirillum sediminis]MBB1486750.1 transglutaminase domain-containing protein [Oceanospirillum sediminis]
MSPFLRSTLIINWDHPEVLALASYLAKGDDDPISLVRRSFEWVRDEIRHSWEYQKETVVLKASEVLRNKHGCCFAKSHLFAALLRANGIPAGFSYQRVPNEWGATQFRLHGINAVYLAHSGWVRLDARGGNSGDKTRFNPPDESFSFPEETCITGIWPNPLECVVEALVNAGHVKDLYQSLPDIHFRAGMRSCSAAPDSPALMGMPVASVNRL